MVEPTATMKLQVQLYQKPDPENQIEFCKS